MSYYSSSIWPFESWKGRKEGGKNYKKIEYFKNIKNFSDEIKSIFHNFCNAFSW